jgi:hypothetical protein
VVRIPYPTSAAAEPISLSSFNIQTERNIHDRSSTDYVSASQGREGI